MSALYVKYICSNIINRIFLNVNTYDVETQMQKYLKKMFETQSVNDVYAVFEELITEIRNSDDSYENSRIINNVYHIIETEYMTDLTLESVAQRLYFSASYLSHLFKKETGYSVANYISTKRLLHARALIQSGTSVTEACFASGFKNYSTFSRAYKKLFLISAREHR